MKNPRTRKILVIISIIAIIVSALIILDGNKQPSCKPVKLTAEETAAFNAKMDELDDSTVFDLKFELNGIHSKISGATTRGIYDCQPNLAAYEESETVVANGLEYRVIYEYLGQFSYKLGLRFGETDYYHTK